MSKHHPTILCVDDDANTLDLFQALLGIHLPQVRLLSASDNTTALEVLKHHAIDLVTTDWYHPDGGDVLAQVIKQQYPHLPVLLISLQEPGEAKSLFADILWKPFECEDYINFVRKHLPKVSSPVV